MSELLVDLAERSYPIIIESDLLARSGILEKYVSGSQVLIVSNDTVAPLYLDKIKDKLKHISTVDSLVLPDGEQYKNLDTLNLIYDRLLEGGHNRTTTLIALGGGVIGDLTGFAAASYQRGVKFVQIPTTLLSQVDSSVGGKTGVNHRLGKNMIGAFYQPQAVLIDTATLNTLPDRELSAGLAEVIKYGLINDLNFFVWLEENIHRLRERQPAILAESIERSCENKARIVSLDEQESGIRALLNLGHTFGHAIESHAGYGAWLHGEAVAAGTVVAAELSRLRGYLDKGDVARIRAILESAGLPVSVPDAMSHADFLDKMMLDKKVINGKQRYVLLKAIGDAIVESEVEKEQVMDAIDCCR